MASLPTRDDTLLGVCEGLGEEFGVHANALRIALGAALLFAPAAAIGGYLVLGALLVVARRLWPHPVAAAVPVEEVVPHGDNDAATLPLAA